MTGLKTFCDEDNNIVGYAISAITSSLDPSTCVSSFGLQAEYYDTDFNVLGSSLPAGWGECCCGGSETVTTLVEDPVNKTATYTNEVGAVTVLSETDFTANSQTIPVPCETLPDARIIRELPVRWDDTNKVYRAYDDGTIYNKMGDLQVITFPVGAAFNTGDSFSQTGVVRVFNPSNCRTAKFDPQITLSISGNSVTAGTWDLWAYVGYSINTPWVGVPVNGPLPVMMTSTAGVGIISASTCMPVFYGGVIIPAGGYVDVAIRGELRARNTAGGGNTTLPCAAIVKYDLSTDV